MKNRTAETNGGARLKMLGLALTAALILAGCGHKLVANAGEHTVKVYPDQATFDKLAKLKAEGGAMGMLGGIGQNIAAKEVDDRTPVRIVSSNDEGSEIEVIDGPFKGLKGFVPRQNVN
ncbi:MAG TPA: hypothetical protein VFB33_10410 [Candidatus Binataceae bacterium]|jgi:transcription antitermination factor NusG|nr:hypothetical protein [Candidatus Binataceae bacterium]